MKGIKREEGKKGWEGNEGKEAGGMEGKRTGGPVFSLFEADP